MRSSQWFVLFFAFLILQNILIQEDLMIGPQCIGLEDAAYWACVSYAEVNDPMIQASGFLWVGFFICGIIESYYEWRASKGKK